MNTCTAPGCHEAAYYPASLPPEGEPVTEPATRCYTHRPERPVHRPAPVDTPEPPPIEPKERIIRLRDRLDLLARDVAHAEHRIRQERRIIDGYPTQTPGASLAGGHPHDHDEECAGCDTCDPLPNVTRVEVAVLARNHLDTQEAQMRNDITGLERIVQSLSKTARQVSGYRAPIEVPRCDGRPFDGSNILWTPRSKQADNGWYDPTCAAAANASGLCDRCQVRERRWRDTRGLEPRRRNSYQPAA